VLSARYGGTYTARLLLSAYSSYLEVMMMMMMMMVIMRMMMVVVMEVLVTALLSVRTCIRTGNITE
jgi:hypothetical protein